MPETANLLSYLESVDLLNQYQIAAAPAHLVKTPSQAAAIASAIGFPVAVKAVSPRFTHKSDRGLLRLNLVTAAQVEQAAVEISAKIPAADLEGILVQQMVTGGIEMIIGVQKDPQFGRVVMLGAGGTLVELLGDVVLRLAPITSREALDMIRQLRIYKLLLGFRGSRATDLAALQALLVRVSRLAVEREDLESLDLNPVMVAPETGAVVAVDFRVVVSHK